MRPKKYEHIALFCLYLISMGLLSDSYFHVFNVNSSVYIIYMVMTFFVVCFTELLTYKDSHKRFSVIRSVLFMIAFLQTVLWIVDPSNPNHEPRTIFILSVAGLSAYFKDRLEQAEKLDRLEEEVELQRQLLKKDKETQEQNFTLFKEQMDATSRQAKEDFDKFYNDMETMQSNNKGE